MIIAEIRKLRISKGLTQSQLANMAEVSLPTIQNIESQKANPSLSVLEKILSVLDAQLVLIMSSKDLDITNYFNTDNIQFKNFNIESSLKELNQKFRDTVDERKMDLYISLYASLLDHYENWLKKNKLYKSIAANYKKYSTHIEPNRLIKFRRIWLSKLSLVI